MVRYRTVRILQGRSSAVQEQVLRRGNRHVDRAMEFLGPPRKPPRNRILTALPADAFERIRGDLELVSLTVRDIIYDVGKPIDRVFFVETGVLSIVSLMADGSAVETATVGFEGMIGVPLFLDTDRSATQAFCQVPGESLTMRREPFRRFATGPNGLRPILNRYVQALFTQVAQSSACNRIHPVRQRCARWLLQTHDRVEGDEFPLTHDFLSQMLGVRRATVTEAVGSLQADALLEYERGWMRVKNRPGLERVSCECYAIVRSEFDRLLDGRTTSSPLDGLPTAKDGKTTINNGTPRRGPAEE